TGAALKPLSVNKATASCTLAFSRIETGLSVIMSAAVSARRVKGRFISNIREFFMGHLVATLSRSLTALSLKANIVPVRPGQIECRKHAASRRRNRTRLALAWRTVRRRRANSHTARAATHIGKLGKSRGL